MNQDAVVFGVWWLTNAARGASLEAAEERARGMMCTKPAAASPWSEAAARTNRDDGRVTNEVYSAFLIWRTVRPPQARVWWKHFFKKGTTRKLLRSVAAMIFRAEGRRGQSTGSV